MSDTENQADDARPVRAIEGREAMRDAIIELIKQANSQLLILSKCLESGVYKHPELIETLKYRLLEQRRLQVRVIVSEPSDAHRQAEAFVNLARRLSSQFEFREPDQAKFAFETECVIADRRGYVQRNSPNSLVSRFALNDPIGAQLLRKEFEEHWHHSQPSLEFRQLR